MQQDLKKSFESIQPMLAIDIASRLGWDDRVCGLLRSFYDEQQRSLEAQGVP